MRYCRCGRPQFKQIPFKWHESATCKENPVDRFLGLELEIYKTKNFKPIKEVCEKWHNSIDYDGSIPGDNGFEIQTSPSKGIIFLRHVDELTEALREGDSRISSKCGFHVHVDGRDLNWTNVVNLIKLHNKVEKALLSMVASHRQSNYYCNKCGDLFLNKLLECKGLSDLEVQRKVSYCFQKYHAMNLGSWISRKTIEYRLYQGTIKKNSIKNWAILCGGMIEQAKIDDVELLEGKPENILLAISPRDEIKEWVLQKLHSRKKEGS